MRVAIDNMNVVIDVSVAEGTSNTYTASINEINVIMNDLRNCIIQLANDSKGEASNKFTLDHFPKLYASMQKHVEMIKNLQQEIAAAVQDFNALDAELKGKF